MDIKIALAGKPNCGKTTLFDALTGTNQYVGASAYSFMIFSLLCAPCFGVMGAIKREMNNTKWTFGAIGYMCLWAYVVSLIVYQIGGVILGEVSFGIGAIVAAAATKTSNQQNIAKRHGGNKLSIPLCSVDPTAFSYTGQVMGQSIILLGKPQ